MKNSAAYREFAFFCVVGIINTAVDFGIFGLIRFIYPVWGEMPAQAFGYTAGLICGFFLNKYVTFKNNAKNMRQVFLFLLCNAVSLGVSVAAIHILTSVGMNEYIAKLFFVTPVTMLINFTGYRFVVFKK